MIVEVACNNNSCTTRVGVGVQHYDDLWEVLESIGWEPWQSIGDLYIRAYCKRCAAELTL